VICCKRAGSPGSGRPSRRGAREQDPLASAVGCMATIVAATAGATMTGRTSSRREPATIRETSRRSTITPSYRRKIPQIVTTARAGEVTTNDNRRQRHSRSGLRKVSDIQNSTAVPNMRIGRGDAECRVPGSLWPRIEGAACREREIRQRSRGAPRSPAAIAAKDRPARTLDRARCLPYS